MQVVLWVELTPAQRTEYRRLLEKSYHALTATKSASGAASKGNLGWQLRLLCDHPNLNLRDPRPASLPAPGGPAAEAALASLVDASGKLRLLHKLLGKLRANKQRVLIFSQFKNMLDLIEDSLHLGGYPHERLDGSVRRDLRDEILDLVGELRRVVQLAAPLRLQRCGQMWGDVARYREMQGDIGRYTSASSCGAVPSSGGINSGDTSVVGGLVGGRSSGQGGASGGG